MPYITSIERLGIQKGRKEGREEGILAGQIILLQQLLGQSAETEEVLAERPLDELKKQVEDLRQQFDSRER